MKCAFAPAGPLSPCRLGTFRPAWRIAWEAVANGDTKAPVPTACDADDEVRPLRLSVAALATEEEEPVSFLQLQYAPEDRVS
jgi:hypothetical protein